jgi:hypothetical protein
VLRGKEKMEWRCLNFVLKEISKRKVEGEKVKDAEEVDVEETQ